MAIDIFAELQKGNIDVLEKLIHSDRKVAIELIKEVSNKNEILMKILPKFRDEETWYGVAHDIFNLIYLDPKFIEYTYYLLHSEYVMLEDLTDIELNNMLEHTTWGFDYIIDNIETLTEKRKINKMVKVLLEYSKDNKELCKKIKEKLLTSKKQEIRDNFIINSNIDNLSDNDILSSFYQNPDDYYFKQETLPFYKEEIKLVKSEIPKFLRFYSLKKENIKKLMLDNFELFFETESDSKMRMLDFFIESLDKETKDKYKDIYEMYKKQPTMLIDKFISIMLNNNLLDWLTSFIKDKKVLYLTSGSTTSVFKVDNLVLKLSLEKHQININKDLFLIAPTQTKIIYKNNEPILIIEVQKYLNKVYKNHEMTEEDIEVFFKQLDELGYEARDPRCLNKSFCNFGFLEDYHDANLGKFSSHEELPDTFKKRPMVLYDVDLVYEKDDPSKKTFTL